MTASLTNGTTTVVVADILAAPLSRPLRRDVLDQTNAAAPKINAGTPGKLAGTITYLCDTLASALALDALYQSAATITLTSDAGAPLNGLQHVAVGDLRYNAERGLPGRPSKWTITVVIREL